MGLQVIAQVHYVWAMTELLRQVRGLALGSGGSEVLSTF